MENSETVKINNLRVCCHGDCFTSNLELETNKNRFSLFPFPKPCTNYTRSNNYNLGEKNRVILNLQHDISNCTQCKKTQRWAKLCHRIRPKYKNLVEASKDTFICAKHFPQNFGPTETNPDPYSATFYMDKIEKLKKILGSTDNITFQKLGDSKYVKINSRGKTISDAIIDIPEDISGVGTAQNNVHSNYTEEQIQVESAYSNVEEEVTSEVPYLTINAPNLSQPEVTKQQVVLKNFQPSMLNNKLVTLRPLSFKRNDIQDGALKNLPVGSNKFVIFPTTMIRNNAANNVIVKPVKSEHIVLPKIVKTVGSHMMDLAQNSINITEEPSRVDPFVGIQNNDESPSLVEMSNFDYIGDGIDYNMLDTYNNIPESVHEETVCTEQIVEPQDPDVEKKTIFKVPTKYNAKIHVNEMCRICLRNRKNIYDINKMKNAAGVPYSTIFTQCTSLDMTPNDRKPTTICQYCLRLLELFYEFREECKKSDEKLQKGVQSKIDCLGVRHDHGYFVQPENAPDEEEMIYNQYVFSDKNELVYVNQETTIKINEPVSTVRKRSKYSMMPKSVAKARKIRDDALKKSRITKKHLQNTSEPPPLIYKSTSNLHFNKIAPKHTDIITTPLERKKPRPKLHPESKVNIDKKTSNSRRRRNQKHANLNSGSDSFIVKMELASDSENHDKAKRKQRRQNSYRDSGQYSNTNHIEFVEVKREIPDGY